MKGTIKVCSDTFKWCFCKHPATLKPICIIHQSSQSWLHVGCKCALLFMVSDMTVYACILYGPSVDISWWWPMELGSVGDPHLQVQCLMFGSIVVSVNESCKQINRHFIQNSTKIPGDIIALAKCSNILMFLMWNGPIIGLMLFLNVCSEHVS